MNNDVSANAFSSGSRKVELTAGGKRYTTKIAAVVLLVVIYLFIIVENARYVISDI